MIQIQHFIGGEFLAGGDQEIRSLNPSEPTTVLATAQAATAELVDKAVQAALARQPEFRAQTGQVRSNLLFAWAEAIAARQNELAEAIAREVGKPIGEARGEVGRCVVILRYYASECVRPNGEVIPGLAPNVHQYSVREPLGVVGLITPWNFPLAIPLWKAAPALAVGNAVILKTSEHSLLCGQLLAETAKAAGLKAEFQVLHGAGDTGRALVEHPGVSAISFTGSDRTGKAISLACAERNKKFQTEMGGKNVAIVLADADLKQAANLVAGGAMRFAGQKCTATSRVVVDRSIEGKFVDALRGAIESLPVGSPMEASTAIGPVISEESQSRISQAIGSVETIYRADVPNEGFFVSPTVVGGLGPDDELSQTELFGPVLSLFSTDSFEEAIEVANNTRFGLSASLCTRDLSAAFQYIDKIKAGMVRVNADTTGVDPHAPFGGYKGSSSGTREQGQVATDFYTQIKTVQINF